MSHNSIAAGCSKSSLNLHESSFCEFLIPRFGSKLSLTSFTRRLSRNWLERPGGSTSSNQFHARGQPELNIDQARRQGKYRNWDRAPSSHSCIVSQYRSLRKMDAAACAEKFPQSKMGTECWPELWGSPDTAWLVNETGQRHKHTKLGWHDALGQIAKVLWLWSLFSPALVLDHPGKHE